MPEWLAHPWSLVLACNYLLAVLAVLTILRRPRDPTAMLSWIFAVLLLPFIGLFVYWLFGENHVVQRAGKRRRRIIRRLTRMGRWDPDAPFRGVVAAHEARDQELLEVEQLTERVGGGPAIGGNQVLAFEESQQTYAAIEQAIRAARHHVHMTYYIWQPDETGRFFRDLLIEKAQTGVECRVLLDSVGSFKLGKRFLQPLHDAGVEVAFYLPLFPFRKNWSLHLRNHRKIVVVDGDLGFTGSQNIGDEYRGRLKKLSPWYDSHLQIRGPAVGLLQQVFAEDWLLATGRTIKDPAYFRVPPAAGETVMQIVPSGPDRDVNSLIHILYAMVSRARRSVRVATPYFCPDPLIQTALLHAAYRGARVQLLLPTRSDAPLILWAGRSFYKELIEAGIEVYENDKGVLHSKVITVDDRWALVGSANMDIRSFRLNFEITAMLYDADVTAQLVATIERRVAESRRLMANDVNRGGAVREVLQGAARLFAPLL